MVSTSWYMNVYIYIDIYLDPPNVYKGPYGLYELVDECAYIYIYTARPPKCTSIKSLMVSTSWYMGNLKG